MKLAIPVFAFLFAIPVTAGAEVILKNRDSRAYQLAIRHPNATKTMTIPSGSYLIVSDGAQTIQLRDTNGRPRGEPVAIVEGDRLEVRGGKLVKIPAESAKN